MKPLIFIMILWCWAFYTGQAYYSWNTQYYADGHTVKKTSKYTSVPEYLELDKYRKFPMDRYWDRGFQNLYIDDSGNFERIQITFTEEQKKNIPGFKEEIKPKKSGFFEGILLYKYNKLYGYADRFGKTIRGPVYEKASLFKDGLAEVKVAGKSGNIMNHDRYLIDTAENIIVGPYQHIGIYSDGLLPVSDGKEWYYITLDGKKTFDCSGFTYLDSFYKGYAKVRDAATDNWGIIDRSGQYVILPKYYWIDELIDGHAVAQKNVGNEEYFFVTDTGKELPGIYRRIWRLTDGNMVFQIQECSGIMDSKLNIILPAIFDSLTINGSVRFSYLFSDTRYQIPGFYRKSERYQSIMEDKLRAQRRKE